MSVFAELKGSSIRTLAWLGDAEYEREVRLRLAQSGDWPADVLDRLKTSLSCAEFQAQLLTSIEAFLSDDEAAWARRGRNATVRSNGRVARDVKTYRQSTAFETLIAKWILGDADERARFHELVVPRLQLAIDNAVKALRKAPRLP